MLLFDYPAIYLDSSCVEVSAPAIQDGLASLSSLNPLQAYVASLPQGDGGRSFKMVAFMPDQHGAAMISTATDQVSG